MTAGGLWECDALSQFLCRHSSDIKLGVPGVLVRHISSALNVMTILEPEMTDEGSLGVSDGSMSLLRVPLIFWPGLQEPVFLSNQSDANVCHDCFLGKSSWRSHLALQILVRAKTLPSLAFQARVRTCGRQQHPHVSHVDGSLHA